MAGGAGRIIILFSEYQSPGAEKLLPTNPRNSTERHDPQTVLLIGQGPEEGEGKQIKRETPRCTWEPLAQHQDEARPPTAQGRRPTDRGELNPWLPLRRDEGVVSWGRWENLHVLLLFCSSYWSNSLDGRLICCCNPGGGSLHSLLAVL